MPQLLLEILSEEVPARMQAKAQADLERALMDGLTAAGLIPEGVKGFSGPRRLVAVVEGLPVKSADVSEDIQGPKEGAPQPAIDGFLRKAGLKSISEAHLHEVPKKGKIYIAHVRKPGRETAALIAELVPQIIRNFHWPKSMRWGNGDLRWVRPISRILCTFDGEVVPFEIEGIKSSNVTEGHRVLGRGPFQVRRFDDYEEVLRTRGAIILDREQRKELILSEARTLCAAQNLELVEDIGLLEEVAGLAEHPVVIIGDMDKAFLDLPPEVIKLSMRTHQKYFAVRDPARADGGLAPKFIVVANLTASDGGEKIAQGNSRVLSARLNDARFFWDNDRKVKLSDRFKKLGQIVFHEKLGSVKQRAERMMALSNLLADEVGADPNDATRAAQLAKCDLVSDMVGEFAELEGVMGRYYAKLDQEKSEVANAVRDHYKPKGPSDEVPTEPVTATVALADKLDTLLGFWAINEKPSGSRDPFALRRAALGLIRISLANQIRVRLNASLVERWLVFFYETEHDFPLSQRLKDSFSMFREHDLWASPSEWMLLNWDGFYSRALPTIRALWAAQENAPESYEGTAEDAAHAEELEKILVERATQIDGLLPQALKVIWKPDPSGKRRAGIPSWPEPPPVIKEPAKVIADDLLAFFADRLKVHLREQGARHDLIDAVFALGEDDLVLIVKRVEALGAFLDTEDGKNLLAGSKRGANILKAEEKKDGEGAFNAAPDPKLFKLPEETALADALAKAAPAAREAVAKENFAAAMTALSALRGPVDAFFDKVTVNDADPTLRKNRLSLLAQIRSSLGAVADFSKIEG